MLTAAVAIFIATLIGLSFQFGRGSVFRFSPESLVSERQTEARIPFIGIPVYRANFRPFEYPLVAYLVDNGHWKPEKNTRTMILTANMNRQWKDGHSSFHREFSWNSSDWIEWTEQNPEFATVLWPAVLTEIKTNANVDRGYEIMMMAKFSANIEKFKESLGK
jgi:hypothetical protein